MRLAVRRHARARACVHTSQANHGDVLDERHFGHVHVAGGVCVSVEVVELHRCLGHVHGDVAESDVGHVAACVPPTPAWAEIASKGAEIAVGDLETAPVETSGRASETQP
eukprot:60847-Prorocentrum_minimum.AAC.1